MKEKMEMKTIRVNEPLHQKLKSIGLKAGEVTFRGTIEKLMGFFEENEELFTQQRKTKQMELLEK